MEQFVYSSIHLPALKKYGITKILFTLLGCLVLLLQSITWLIVWLKGVDVSTSDLVFVTITLVSALFFTGSQIFFAIRNKNIRETIKYQGSFQTFRPKLKFSNKASIGGGLVVFCRIIAVVFVILLGVLMANFILDYLNWGKVILKTPIMVLIAVWFLNTSAELRFQTMIEKAN